MGAGDADVKLTIQAATGASVSAAEAGVRDALKALETTAKEASSGEAAAVAAVREQYEAAGAAVRKLEAAVDKARSAGAPVSADTSARLREAEQRLADLRKQLAGIPDAVEPIDPALEAAEAAARSFAEAVAKGGRGAERQLGLVNTAIENLETEIKRLRAAGQPVAELEARLARLRSEVARDTQQLGRFRAGLRDAQDELKRSTRAAGEFEGQLTSLEDVLGAISPSLGNLAGKGVAIAGGISIVLYALQQLIEVTEKVGKVLGERYERSLSDAIDEQDRMSGSSVRLAQNLRDVLAKEGYDVAALHLDELLQKDAEFQQRLIERRAEAERLAKAITGDAKALRDSTQAVLAGLREAQEGHVLNAQQAKLAVAALDGEIAAYEKLGKVAPAALVEARKALVLLGRTEADVHDEHDKFLTDFGVKTQEDFFESARRIREFNLEAQISGEVAPAAALKIIAAVEELAAQQALLPATAREATAGVLESLHEIQEGYRETANVALAAFGVQTPDAIRRSAEAIAALAAAYGPLAEVNKEQAEKIKAEALKILDAIALLPKAQQAAVADVTGSLVTLVTKYGEAAAKQREFALDVEAFEKASLERRRAAVSAFTEALGSGLSALIEQLRQVDQATTTGPSAPDTEALKRELAELQALQAKAPISPEQEGRIAEIGQLLTDAGEGATRFAGGLEQASRGQAHASATAEQVNSVLRQVVGSLGDNAEGWRALGIAQREALETLLGQLQAAGNQGFATADVLQGSLGQVREILQGAGLDTSELDDALGGLASGAVDLDAAFSKLDNSLDSNAKAFNEFAGKATEGTKKTKLGVDDMKKSVEGTTEKMHDLGTTTKQAGEIMHAALQPAANTLDSIATKLQLAIGLAHQLGQVEL